MSPLGRLSDPLSLDEVRAQIEQGRAFPPQGVSRDGEAVGAASELPELRDVWARVSPPTAPFDGAAGRARPLVLARLVAALAAGRASGYLSVRQSDADLHFMVRVVDGQVLDICAHDPSTYLGQLLVQQGVLTPADLARVLRLALERGAAVGRVCVEEGLLSAQRLNRALAEQLFTRLRRVACFPRCDVLFRADRAARMLPPVARISGYAALEICLGYGLSDAEIKEYPSSSSTRPPCRCSRRRTAACSSGCRRRGRCVPSRSASTGRSATGRSRRSRGTCSASLRSPAPSRSLRSSAP